MAIDPFFFCSAFILAFKYCAQGSRILVTTRKGRVAKMIGSAHIMNLGQLSNVNCWLIFSIHLGTPFASTSGRKTRFIFFFFFFFFQAETFDFYPMNSALVHCSRVPQTLLFSNFFIKNRSHSTIYIFKNYFAIVFFNFQLYPNGPLVK